MRRKKNIVPPNREGVKSESHYSLNASTLRHAEVLYRKGKQNLLNVNNWKNFAGGRGAEFQLTAENGEMWRWPARQGCYIRIHLPVAAANKFDWVRIESIQVEENIGVDRTIMRVRPAPAPGSARDPDHFFSAKATSSFIVEKSGTKIKATVCGRNELPNVSPDTWLDKLRNLVIALLAMLGLNTPQWKALARGLLTGSTHLKSMHTE